MINKTLRKKLAKHLKTSFLADVLVVLEKKSIRNKSGLPFSRAYISYVYNGKYENTEIEIAIIEVYNERKEQQKKYVEQQKNMLK